MSDRADPFAWYATHGPITDPGTFGNSLNTLPLDLPNLCRAVRGLVVHYRSDELAGMTLPPVRFDEVRTRHVSRMLARLAELDPAPLNAPRPLENRLIGCCRDVATLLCAVLRHQGRPARVRVGFATYLAPDIVVDHWVTEMWHAGTRRWVLVDAERARPISAPDGSIFDPGDVPRDQFQVAGQVWEACRQGNENPDRFGYDAEQHGLWVIRANLLQDLACLNRIELTPWDFWGLGLVPFEHLTPDDLALLDRGASLTCSADHELTELRALHESDARLRVPPVITSYSLDDEPAEVAWDVSWNDPAP